MPLNIVRAWKDPDYRNSLNEEQLAALPENPAGSIDLMDLTEPELAYMQGGANIDPVYSDDDFDCSAMCNSESTCNPPPNSDDESRNNMIRAGVIVTVGVGAAAVTVLFPPAEGGVPVVVTAVATVTL